MDTINKKYYEEIDILKGIAITLVVLGHSVIVYPINLHEISWCKLIYDFVRTTHMPLFFIVSGYCFSFKGNYKGYLWKKCKRILIPYIIFNFIDMIPRALLSVFVNRPRNFGESMYSILFEGGAYWFLYSLFLIFLVFPLISQFLKTNKGKIIICVACVFLKFVPGIPSVFLLRRTVYHLLYFVLGYSIKDFLDINWAKKRIIDHRQLSIIGMIAIFLIMFYAVPYYAKEDTQLLGIPLALLGIIAFFTFSCRLKQCFFRDILIGFGKYSLQIYLLNGFLLTISRTFMVTILHIEIPLVIILFNLLFDLVFSYFVIKVFLSKYRVFRVIMGIV